MFGADLSAVNTGGGHFRYQAHHVTMQNVHGHRRQRCYFSMCSAIPRSSRTWQSA